MQCVRTTPPCGPSYTKVLVLQSFMCPTVCPSPLPTYFLLSPAATRPRFSKLLRCEKIVKSVATLKYLSRFYTNLGYFGTDSEGGCVIYLFDLIYLMITKQDNLLQA